MAFHENNAQMFRNQEWSAHIITESLTLILDEAVCDGKHPQRRAIISKDEDEDDKSLYNCARKYAMIVKQFDELMGIMNNPTNIPKSTRSQKAGASGTSMAAGASQPESNGVLAEAVTRFLYELKS